MFTKVTIAALFAGLAAAYHAPVGDPTGNPITRPLNEIVPAGKSFTITWTPTTTNKVSLLLLKGPSTNVVPIETLVEGLDNSGSFTFTPSNSLEATPDATGYGLQLIDDVTGQYQYSTQFGISVSEQPASSAVIPASSAVIPASSAVIPAGYPVASSIVVSPSETPAPAYPVVPVVPANSTLATICSTTSTVTVYLPPVSTAAVGGNNYTAIQPTQPLTVSGYLPSGTGVPSGVFPPPIEFTGAASSLKAGLGLVGAVAGLFFML